MRTLLEMDAHVKTILRKQVPAPGKSYRRSRFVMDFSMDGNQYHFNTLTGQCILTGRGIPSETVYSPEMILQDKELYELLQVYFLVPSDRDETVFYLCILDLMRAMAGKKGYGSFRILPTMACNARCVYCFQGNLPKVTMTEEVVDKTISFIVSSRRKETPVILRWFGGEPLLCTEVIDRVCRALSEKGIPFWSEMTTNGSLIDALVLDRMSGSWQMKQVQISMDCAEAEYIARKKYIRYDDTYRRVMDQMEQMLIRGIRVMLRCNVDLENADRIPEFLTDLSGRIQSRERLTVGFEPLFAEAEKDTEELLLQRIREASHLVREAGFQAFAPKDVSGFRVNHCMADDPAGSIVIAPSGDLYPCTFCEPGTSFGTVGEGILRPDILASYTDTAAPQEQCRECVFLPLCTPFSKCPIKKPHCVKRMKEKTSEMLLRRIKNHM